MKTKSTLKITCSPAVQFVQPIKPVLPEPSKPFILAKLVQDDAKRDLEIMLEMAKIRVSVRLGAKLPAKYMALWREHEDIKNRNGGMPPNSTN